MPSIDVSELIDRNRISRFQIRVLILCCAVAIFDGFDAQAIGYLGPAILADWHIPREELSLLFSAGISGLAVGAMTGGSLGDRYGRRTMAIASLAFGGFFSIMKAEAHSISAFIAYQFVAGVALGWAYPVALALMAEYSPARRRATMTACISVAYAIGSAGAGIIAGIVVGPYGWRAVFYGGGAAALLVVPAVVLFLPELLRLLAVRNPSDARLKPILRAIQPNLDLTGDVQIRTGEKSGKGFPVRQLFTDGRATTTLLLWVAAFMALVIVFIFQTWIPILINTVGVPLNQVPLVVSPFHIGAMIGGFGLGYLMDRTKTLMVIAASFVLGAVAIGLMGSVGASIPLLAGLTFACGVTSGGAFGALGVAAGAMLYPTPMRATGAGWALGVGRAGSLVGPLIVSAMIGLGWAPREIFYTVMIPGLVCAAAVYLIAVRGRRDVAPVYTAVQS